MSDVVDTNAEATAMIAYQIRHLPAEGLAHSDTREDFARHVEALLAERDAALAEVARLRAVAEGALEEGMQRAVNVLRARHKGLEHLREYAEAQHAADEIEAAIRALKEPT